MAFRLLSNLAVGGQYQAVNTGDVTVLENSLPAHSRMLVGVVFAERYDGFLEDCERAETALREAGIPSWVEYDRLVTPDPDGEPVAWISYQSSPAFWAPILLIIGSIFLLPILSALPMWIIDKLFPGAMDIITNVVVLGIMVGVMMFMPKMVAPAKEKKMIQQIQPYQQPQPYQPLQVEAMWFQNLVFILLTIGMVAYFFKKGPANFFEKMWEE